MLVHLNLTIINNNTWMMEGRLKMPTEAQLVAAQDQALPVRAVQSCIYGIPVSVLGMRELCWNNFGNNDEIKESRIIPEF